MSDIIIAMKINRQDIASFVAVDGEFRAGINRPSFTRFTNSARLKSSAYHDAAAGMIPSATSPATADLRLGQRTIELDGWHPE